MMRPAILAVAFSRNNNSLNLEPEHAPATTPSRQRPTTARPPLRSPLQPRDHNAMMRAPLKGSSPLHSKSGPANMPASYDKQTAGRPLMPTLSAAAKTSNRTPLTPRVAASAPPRTSTPLSRRGPRSDISTPATASREDVPAPVASFLSNNITPRSGSRKSRIDSTNTTPTGTPNGTPVPPHSHDPPAQIGGLGIIGLEKDIPVPRRPTVSFSYAVSDMPHSRSPPKPPAGESKFFFANDASAKSVPAKQPPRSAQTKTSTFFYANGESIPPPVSSSASAVGSNIGDEKTQPRFFRANGTPDLQESPLPRFPPPRPSSTASTASHMTSQRRLATASPGPLSPPQGPVSPTKLNKEASVASLRNSPALPSPVFSQSQARVRGQAANGAVTPRRASVEIEHRVASHGTANCVVAPGRASIEIEHRVASHGRSASAGSPNSIPSRRRFSSSASSMTPPPSTPANPNGNSLYVSTPEEIPELEEAVQNKVPSEPQSPSKTKHSIEHMNELAANARRERKVLDLEITNSSLTAINRTLEREMRKQTAELRRYRRLSRSGRLSIVPSSSLRTSAGSLSILDGVEGAELSDMSEEESDESDEFDSEEDSIDDTALSPRAMAESDLRHRKRDEQRLQLDLSKHQQLLIDSQSMNQSLKRCLGRTEVLISEGKKALEYQVRVSDIELGGRVLTPDEAEDGENDGMSAIGARMLREARKAAAQGIATWSGVVEDDGDTEVDPDSGKGLQRNQEHNSLAALATP